MSLTSLKSLDRAYRHPSMVLIEGSCVGHMLRRGISETIR